MMKQGLTAEDYCHYSYLQIAGAHLGLKFFKQAAASLPVEADEKTLCLVNYGSAGGLNAKPYVAEALKIFKERFPEKAVSIVYNDQPDNSFSAIFNAFQMENPPFVFAAGRSFYDQIMPENSVNLAWSSYAAIFLSSHIFGEGEGLASYCVPPGSAFQKKATQQAKKDWRQFLLLRSKELMPKGYLLCVTPGRKKEGWETGFNPIINQAWQVLKSLAPAWEIDLEAADFLRIMVYLRSDEEVLEPLQAPELSQIFEISHFETCDLLEEECLVDSLKTIPAAKRHTDFFMATFSGNLEVFFTFSKKPQTKENFESFKKAFEKALYALMQKSSQPVNQHIQILLLQKK